VSRTNFKPEAGLAGVVGGHVADVFYLADMGRLSGVPRFMGRLAAVLVFTWPDKM
jgi:hypothetical protein